VKGEKEKKRGKLDIVSVFTAIKLPWYLQRCNKNNVAYCAAPQ